MISPLRWVLLVCVFATSLRADFVKDLAQNHTEAVGGRARVDALKSLKATGATRSERGELRFVLWAARPNKIRTEITSGMTTLVQAWDGVGSPWAMDLGSLKSSSMPRLEEEEAFKVDAEFDDPLLAGPTRQVSLDYSGPVRVNGRELIKVLVVQNFTATSLLFLDPATYLIVRRDVIRKKGAKEVRVQTDYSDFRAVGGVIMAHRLVVTLDGKRLHETVIDRIEPNPVLPADLFKLPANAKPVKEN